MTEEMVLSRDWKPRRDVGGFLRKHHRSVTLIGAIIVFVTFIVKEALRDHLKDLVDSIENARSVFLIRDGEDALRSQLESINERFAKPTTTDKFVYGVDASTELTLSLVDAKEQSINSSLGNIADLLNELPSQRNGYDRRQQLDGIRSREQYCHGQREAIDKILAEEQAAREVGDEKTASAKFQQAATAAPVLCLL